MAGFRRTRRGLVGSFSEPERDLLLHLLEQTAGMLESAGGKVQPSPTDVSAGRAAPVGDAGGVDADADSFETIMRGAGFAPGFGSDVGGEGVVGHAGNLGDLDDVDAWARSAPGPGRPEDPAVRRLLPDGHHDDPELAAEFRRLTGDAVRDRKLGHLHRAIELVSETHGTTLRPTDDQARSLLIALTDIRLVLAERLELHTDEAAESLSDRLGDMDPEDPRFPLALAYEFLTWVQETLATALSP